MCASPTPSICMDGRFEPVMLVVVRRRDRSTPPCRPPDRSPVPHVGGPGRVARARADSRSPSFPIAWQRGLLVVQVAGYSDATLAEHRDRFMQEYDLPERLARGTNQLPFQTADQKVPDSENFWSRSSSASNHGPTGRAGQSMYPQLLWWSLNRSGPFKPLRQLAVGGREWHR